MASVQVIRFGQLEVHITPTPDEVEYRFKGDVDEHFRQQDLPRVGRPKIVFHLEDINNFNSCGIREWVAFIRDVDSLGKIVFRRCSVTMVDQINMVPDSLGRGSVESFFAPYFCSSCDAKETNRLIDFQSARESIANHIAPTFQCEKCGKDLEFDALEESYFLFADSGVSRAS